MAQKIERTVIDGIQFELTQLGGVEASDLYGRLAHALGPIIADALASGVFTLDAELQLAAMVIKGLSALSPELWLELRIRFSGATKVQAGELLLPLGDGRTLPSGGTFDQHFAGRMGHLNRWMMASLKHNFSDFLPSSAASSAAT